MPTMTALGFQGTGQCQVATINFPGSTMASLGGPLRREVRVDAGLEGIYLRNSCIDAYGYSFALIMRGNVTPRLYQFYQDTATNKVRAIFLTGNPSGAVAAEETVTGDISGATGVVIEDYITGDLFVNIQDCSVTDFQANETITFSGGATATLTASGFLEDNGGEWGIVYTAPTVTINFSPNNSMGSGLFSFTTSDGNIGICFAYLSASGYILCKSITYGSWASSVVNATVPEGFFNGIASIFEGGIYFCYTGYSGSFYMTTLLLDPDTESCSSHTIAPASFNNAARVSNVFSIEDQVFLLIIGGTNYPVRGSVIYNITGGTAVYLTGSAGVITVNFSSIGVFRGIEEEAFYICSFNATAASRVIVHRFAKIGGTYVSNAVNDSANYYSQITSQDIGATILPASLRSGLTTSVWGQYYIDTITTPGSSIQRMWLYTGTSTNPGIGVSSAEEFVVTSPWQELDGGADATWNGTTGTSTDIVFAGAHGCSVGEWVLHFDDNKSYYISGVPSATALTITDLTAQAPLTTIPSTPSVTYKSITALTSIGGNVLGIDASGENVGGGERTFASSFAKAEFDRIVTLEGTTTERFYFRIYGTGSVEISFYYKGASNNQILATISNASSGTIVSNVITGLSGDGGATLYSVDSTVVPVSFSYREISTEAA